VEQKKQLPIGKIDFREFFSKDAPCYYVDKTPFIKELVETSLFSSSANLILRPRRFGKTLALSMLQNFLDLDAKEARPIFETLEIGKDKAFCDKYENKFPVISITFKDVKGRTMESMLTALNSKLCGEYDRHACAADALTIISERQRFERLRGGVAFLDDFNDYLFLLEKALFLKTGIKPLVFIDEYDVPLNEAHQHGFFDAFVSVISGMFSTGLKDNLYVGGAVITGCLQIAKNQIFTGLNNPAICPVTSAKYAQYFGFTKDETTELLHYYGLDSRMDDVRDNYDGYSMGKYSIYNPFSLVNFVKRAVGDKDAPCENYWVSTSGNALLNEMLAASEGRDALKRVFKKFLSGSSVDVDVDKTIIYDTMKESDAAIMGTLLFSGYLTSVKYVSDNRYTLRIPNKEVLMSFRTLVRDYDKTVQASSGDNLLRDFTEGNVPGAESDIGNSLSRTIGLDDLRKDKEYFMHGFLLGALVSANGGGPWVITSQKESGDGYADITLEDSGKRKVIIIEVKQTKEKDIEKGAEGALAQIERKRYAVKYESYAYTIMKYGVCFHGKQVSVKMEETT